MDPYNRNTCQQLRRHGEKNSFLCREISLERRVRLIIDGAMTCRIRQRDQLQENNFRSV